MRLRRAFSAAAAVAIVITGLSACQVKVGQAAYVGNTAVSESDVASYVNVTAPAPASGSIGAKSFVVQELVKKILLNKLATTIGKLPSDSDLSTLHDSALSQVFQTQLSGAAADKQLRSAADQKGLKPTFDALYVHNIELSTAIGTYLQSAPTGDQAKLQKEVNSIRVRLNPRYGSWSSSNLQVDGAAAPSWLKSVSGG